MDTGDAGVTVHFGSSPTVDVMFANVASLAEEAAGLFYDGRFSDPDFNFSGAFGAVRDEP